MRFYDQLMKDTHGEGWVKDSLDGVPVISCDNVSRYFFEESDQEHWDMHDFPNVAPPFASFWLDFKAPTKVVSREKGVTLWKPPAPSYWGFLCFGSLLETQEDRDTFLATTHVAHRNYFQSVVHQAKWHMDMYLSWRQLQNNLVNMWAWRMILNEAGEVISHPLTGEKTVSSMAASPYTQNFIDALAVSLGEEEAKTRVYYNVLPYWHTALLAISFLHCKNVGLSDVKPPLHTIHNKAQKRRGEKPYQPVPYKVLDIWPMKEVLRTEGKSASVGTAKALHICRGHFAHYTDKGLFGKYKGTFWIPQHVKGQKERGVTTKDYTIQL